MLTFTAERANKNPDMPDWKDADHWRCKIGDSMTVHFSKGYGHKGTPPTLDEVAECIIHDDPLGTDFEQWANAFGYECDDKRALKTWRTCMKQAAQLAALIGDNYWKIRDDVLDGMLFSEAFDNALD